MSCELIKQNSTFERSDIRQILRPPDSALVPDERFFAQNENRDAIQLGGKSGRKSILGSDTGEAGEKIDAIR